MVTKQIDLWRSEFGKEYAGRNNNPITDEGMRRLIRDWAHMLRHAVSPKPESVLEVGCNIGRNLIALRHFVDAIHAVEPNPWAVEMALGRKELSGLDIREGHGFDLPFDDASIDLVFTSGVLIHVAPDDLGKFVDEVHRVAKRYILCIEYFSHEPVETKYHGQDGYLFKRDFGKFYLERFPHLRVLDYGFLWQPIDSSDNSNWWLFIKE